MDKSIAIQKFDAIDIYPVITSEFCAGRPPVEVLKAVADGGAKIVQLREKSLPKKQILALACEFRKITSSYGMLLIINDHVGIAKDSAADGVHLGQDDCTIEKAAGTAPELILGVSTHSRTEALDAQARGADYINIGPLFHTGTKSLPIPPLGTDILKSIAPLLHIPFTVMGGIKSHHIPKLIKIGIRKIAMVTEITQAQNITEKIREIRKLFLTS